MRKSLLESVLRKHLGWHDVRENGSGVIGNMLNHEVNSLSAVVIEVAAAYMEGMFAILVGLVLACVYSWPIVVALICVSPIMMVGNKVGHRVKMKQWGML